jgi:flagellar biosynthetic protein FlhB
MAGDPGQEQDKNEAATPFKLAQARRRGQVARSLDLSACLVMLGAVGASYAIVPDMCAGLVRLSASIWASAGRIEWTADGASSWVLGRFGVALELLAPFVVLLACAAVTAGLLQTGGVFSVHPIKPDFDRINPASGAKRLFSMRLLFEAAKSVLKLSLMMLVAWLALSQLVPGLAELLLKTPGALVRWLASTTNGVLVKLLLVMVLVGLLDFAYVHWSFGRQMRMSRRELRDEHKQREGDPRIRSRLRELRNALLRRARAVRKLPGADVLVTNPTHLAVAVAYRHGEMAAPKVLCKGSGELAQRMKALARRHGIPVVENRPLARELYRRIDEDNYVPEDLYPALARILLWVYDLRQGRAAGAAQ